MIQQIVTDSYTKIYIGGGNWLTEAKPTNARTFTRDRILLAGETVEDYVEVTDEERRRMEAEDAGIAQPPQWLIDLFESDPNGGYEPETTTFKLNGLTLTVQEAKAVAYYGRTFAQAMYASGPKIRTNLCLLGQTNATRPAASLFANQTELEVANIVSYYGPLGYSFSFIPQEGYNNGMFSNCRKLHTIYGKIDCVYLSSNASLFGGCVALREVRLDRVAHHINLGDCTSLSLASVQHLVANAINTTSIIVTIHPDVYAKLIDEANPEWHAVLTDAIAKNISFATTN